MADIFVSYSRQNEAFGRKLHSRLTGMKRDVWMDWEDIPFNSDWWQEIKRGIETSDNFLIILTSEFVSSPVCMLEVEHARRNNKRILIIAHNFQETGSNSSILTERTEESDTVRQLLGDRDIVTISRENWRTIGHVNWLFFNDDKTFEHDFRNLIDTLDTDLEHVRTHTTLQVRALDWYANDKNWSFLLTGVQIDNAEEWLKEAIDDSKEPQPTALHSEFIKASRQQQHEQENSILEMQTRAKRFRQASIVAGVIAAIVVIVGIILTFYTGSRIKSVQATLDAQIVIAAQQISDADDQISTANALAEESGGTLTAIPPTIDAILVELDANNTQVASIGETLTPIGATLEFAEIAREAAQDLADSAGTQVVEANATLTPVAVTLTQSADQQATANAQIATASANSLTAEAQLADANAQVELANTEVYNASVLADEANAASTQSAERLATADVQIEEASTQVADVNLRIVDANTVLTQIVPTLTQAGDLVLSASTQIAGAETQVADAGIQIATADVQNQNLQGTAAAIQQIAEINGIQAQSQALIVNAEQAAVNGEIDLALALLLESYELNSNLPQTRRLLNNIAYTSARFILPDASFVTFSSDSTMVAYGDGNDVVILDIVSRAEVARLQGHSDAVVAGDFNFRNTLFVSGSLDSEVLVWDTTTWQIIRRLSDFDVPISDVSFDNQGNRIGAVGAISNVVVWDVNNGFAPRLYEFNNPDTVLTDIFFYGDGSRVLAQGNEGQDRVQYRLNLGNGQFARDLDRIYTTINPAYDVNAGHVPRQAMVETERYLTIYDLVNGNLIEFVNGFNWGQGGDVAGVRAFDSTGTNNIIVALSNQSEASQDLILFNVGQRERSSGLEFEGEATNRVTALAFSPDGRTILSGYGRYLVLWDVQTGRELRRFGTHLDDIVEIIYSLDSNHAITRSRDGNYRVWDVSFSDPAVLNQLEVPNGTGEPITNPGLSPDSSELYFNIASDVYRFDIKRLVQTEIPFSYFGLQDIIYSRVDPYVVTTSADTAASDAIARMWDASSAEPILWNENISGGNGETFDPAGAFSADGQYVALSMSQSVRVYDVSTLFTPRETVRFDRRGMSIAALIFSPDGRYLYAAVNQIDGEENYALVRWDLDTEEQVIIPIPHIRPIISMDISDDGTQIITASQDETVVLFDLENQTILRRLVGHQGDVNVVYFGLDDEVALTASDDGSLILWDLVTGQSIRRFVTGNPVSGLYLSNDSRIAVSTDGTDFVTIWQIETLDDVVDWVRANREIPSLTDEQCVQFEVQCEDGD